MAKINFVRENGLRIHPEFYDLVRKHHLNHFNVLYHLKEGELFKKNRFRSVVRIYLRGSQGKSHIFHLKRHFPPLWDRLKTVLTGFQIRDGAENEWKKILRLEEIGIRTMTPVAFGAIRKMGLPYRSLTLTEHLYGADRLEDYLPAKFGDDRLRREKIIQKRRIISETARWARIFHGSGFHHQDFYLGHIFIRPGEGGNFTLHLIDLQRVREERRLPKSRLIKDLAQLNFSATGLACLTRADRLRFIRAYLDKDRLGRAERNLITRIEKKTQRISSHTEKLLAKRAQAKSNRKKHGGAERTRKSKAPF
jgi:heptose I phosphotransferase